MFNLPHILFVDDEKNILNAIKRELHSNKIKWNFTFADNASEALDILNSGKKIDVIVTDVMMPGMNGYELVKSTIENFPDTYPIVLSGHCDDADKLEFERLNIPVFEKPFPILDLTTTISLYVGTKEM